MADAGTSTESYYTASVTPALADGGNFGEVHGVSFDSESSSSFDSGDYGPTSEWGEDAALGGFAPGDLIAPALDGVFAPNGGSITRDQAISFSLVDAGGLSRIAIAARHGNGRTELVCIAYPSPGSTPVATPEPPYDEDGSFEISNGEFNPAFIFARAISQGGWPSSTLEILVEAVDTSGNATTFSQAYTVSNPGDLVLPDVVFTPTNASTIVAADEITIEVTHELDELLAVAVTAEYADGSKDAVLFVGFSAAFSTSTEDTITNGLSLVIRADAGWRSASVLLNVLTIDVRGHNSISQSTYTVSNPTLAVADTAAPVVGNYSPAPGTAISRASALAFDVTDAGAGLRRAIVAARFPDGTYEIVHDGDAFAPRYSSLSARTTLAGGFRFSVRRTGGWPAAPTLVAFPVDASGNEI